MKIFGVTIIKDYEEIKRMRRDSLTDKENTEFLVEHGHMGILRQKCVYRFSGGNNQYPKYTLSLKTAIFSVATGIIWNLRQSLTGLFPEKSFVHQKHNHRNADSEQ